MGLRKDLDSIKVRYIYVLKHEDLILYVGTAANPKSRFKSHIKRIKTDNALIYRYVKQNGITLKMEVVKKVIGTYADAEKHEIDLIKFNSETILNFYNNPNKKHYYEIEKSLKNL